MEPANEVVLVTGGLGYIGSHTVAALSAAGCSVVILDDLSNSEVSVVSRLRSICKGPIVFVRGDVRDEAALLALLRAHRVTSCLHFAGLKSVANSVATPLEYYSVNVGGTVAVVRALQAGGINKLVFSSSATVYGVPARVPVVEGDPEKPENPYGRSKWMAEQVLTDACAADPALAVIALRYFNPAGAHPSGVIGEKPVGTPNNLMPYVSQVAAGRRALVTVYGSDYGTPDGTGVRDYVHVCDLAEAHVSALRWLSGKQGYRHINVGTGRGYSVLEVIRAFEQATGQRIDFRLASRRAGDIPICYADTATALETLGWRAEKGLAEMCCDAWHFERAEPFMPACIG